MPDRITKFKRMSTCHWTTPCCIQTKTLVLFCFVLSCLRFLFALLCSALRFVLRYLVLPSGPLSVVWILIYKDVEKQDGGKTDGSLVDFVSAVRLWDHMAL